MRYVAMMLFLLVCASTALAEQELSIEEAERIFIENNPVVRVQKAELGKFDAGIIEVGLLSDPVFNYTLESLRNDGRENEEIYTFSQSVDIAGKRGLRKSAAQKQRDAQYLLYSQEVMNALARMKQSYFKVLFLKESEKALRNSIDVFLEVERAAGERLKAGDVAEVELMRLGAERKGFARMLKEVKIERTLETKRLLAAMDMHDAGIMMKEDFYRMPPVPELDEVVKIALERSSSLKAASTQRDAAHTTLFLEKREIVRPIQIEAGYKRRTGGFDGFVFGVSIPLPLFNRNQGRIAAAEAELNVQKTGYETLRKKVMNEVSLLHEKAAFLNRHLAELTEQLNEAREITRIAHISYEEGESSLVEMLDAVRSERELVTEYNREVYEYWAVLFELEKTAGTKLIQSGGMK